MISRKRIAARAAVEAALVGGVLLCLGGAARAQQAAEPAPPTAPMGAAVPVQPAAAEEPVTAKNALLARSLTTAEQGASAMPGEPEAKPRLEITGFAMLDAIYNFDRVDPNWEATLRPSRIQIPQVGKDGLTVFSVRQSRINFVGTIPSAMGDITGRLEFDLFGVGDDEGQTTFRIRHVYGALGNWLIGQTNSLFTDADVFPNTLDYWGPTGIVFFRNPQIRWTGLRKGGQSVSVALEAPGSAVDDGKVDKIDPTLNVASHDELPDLTAQYRLNAPWGHFQASGILRQVGFESRGTPSGEPSGEETGWGLSLGGVMKIAKKDKIYAQFTYGEGISNYMNDGGSDLAPSGTGSAEPVTTTGWELYYEHPWNPKWVSSIGYSEHRQDNTGGQTADAFKAGRYFSVNLLHSPVPDVLMGVEFLWGERENNNGDSGDDTRIQFSFKYNFKS